MLRWKSQCYIGNEIHYHRTLTMDLKIPNLRRDSYYMSLFIFTLVLFPTSVIVNVK